MPETRASAALLGALVTGGWILHDLVVFTTRGSPGDIVALVPGFVMALLLGSLTGFVVGTRPLLFVLLVLVALFLSVAPHFVEHPFTRARTWLPRAVFVLLTVFGVASTIQHRWRPGIVRLGLAGGFLACLVKSVLRFGMSIQSRPLLVATLLVLALGFLRPRVLRRLATAIAVSVPAVDLVGKAVRHASPSRVDLAPPPVQGRGAARDGPNLLLIVLDTVRADRLATYGYERVTTPGLDAFVREHATIYTEARSTSPFTLSSHASIFTGLYPAEHGATHPGASKTKLREDVPTLAEKLRAEGYRTAAVVANDLYLGPDFGLGRGYERLDDRRACWVWDYLALPQYAGAQLLTGHVPYRSAETITDAALAWLDSIEDGRSGAFFLTLNYMDAHDPFLPPPPFDAAFVDERPVDPLAPPQRMSSLLYDRCLAYLDSQLSRLFEDLKARGVFDDTVIVVTSDHGESLGEHGLQNHCWFLYEGLVKVPLFVKPVGRDPAPRVDELVTGADVHGIALRELGLESEPHVPFPGLIGEWHPSKALIPRYADWGFLPPEELERDLIAWLEGRTKYIVSSLGGVEAYDLARDPGELDPLPLTAEEIDAARERARAWWAEHPVEESSTGEADRGLRERMEALGYGGGD